MENRMLEGTQKLELLSGVYAVCRLDADDPTPDWATQGTFWSVTRTSTELSVVCLDSLVPAGVTNVSGWRILMIEGPLDLSSTGILASLVGPLARQGVSVFALSTYDTDYLMVREEQLEEATESLMDGGHEMERGSQETQ